MSEIEVGDYIRTKEGKIGKAIEIKKRENFEEQIFLDSEIISEYEKYFIYEFDIAKHSKNIIDLIEVGDYVNGYKVDSIENGKLIIGNTTQVIEQILEKNKDIKTILTHEQYEENCYKVVE